jgi:hypothetical protein
MAKLHRLTDLFEEGVTLPLRTTVGDEMTIWINKLTPFEQEEANQEGRIARARMMLAINEIGTPEYDLFRAGIQGIPAHAVIESLLANNANKYISDTVGELRSEEVWKERLEIIQFSSDQIAGKPPDDPEVLAVEKVLSEYTAEMDKRTKAMRNAAREELKSLPDKALRERYRLSYVEERGLAAFSAEQQLTQVFFALRRCEGVRREDKTWDHTACDHSQHWLADRNEVKSLPQTLLDQFRRAYAEMVMSPDTARFSEGPANSSASSGPSSKQADSAESGPVATPAEPVTTSS